DGFPAALSPRAPSVGCIRVAGCAPIGAGPLPTFLAVTTSVPSMPLSRDEVERIATLARIALTDEELERTAAQLGQVLALFERLRAVDTTGVEPMTHPHDQTLRLRDDVADETNRREAGQAMAPAVERGLYLVPKVIE